MIKNSICKIIFIIAVLLVLCSSFALATEAETVIYVEDVTSSSMYPVLKGEAKILVSIGGASGRLTNIQTAINFSGGMEFKGIEYIAAKNNPPKSVVYTPSSSLVNVNKRLTPFIVSQTGVELDGNKTPLYLLTFSNENGDGLTINIDKDEDSTYFEVDGSLFAEYSVILPENIVASTTQVDEKEANIRIVMDKVTSFAASGNDNFKSSNVSVEIVSEKTGYTIYTVLNDIPLSQGGHRENSTIPAFTVKETVLSDDTYTLRISGPGYTTIEKNGLTFDTNIEFDNSTFVPGDFNSDGAVDEKDREIISAFVDNAGGSVPSKYLKYQDAVDLNRSGECDIIDKKIFELQLKPEVSLLGKMSVPTLSATSNSVEVNWTKSTDATVTGYTLKYGTSATDLKNTLSISDVNTVKHTVSNLSASTNYYFAVAMVNEAGNGEFSDTVSVKTLSSTSGGGGGSGSVGGGSSGSGGGGSFSGGSGSSSGGNSSVTPTPSTTKKTFDDLAGYEWANDAIYALKDKGIIKGVSENQYSPASNIKRGDFILILSRMITFEGETVDSFADVPADSYYYDAILKAKAAGIASGDGVNFLPENMISRQELITLAYRAFLKKGYIVKNDDTSCLEEFSDKTLIADYAKESMASMVKAGIIKGSDGLVNPLGNATRAEVAVMCERLLKLVK